MPESRNSSLAVLNFSNFFINALAVLSVNSCVVDDSFSNLEMTLSIAGQVMSGTLGAFFFNLE